MLSYTVLTLKEGSWRFLELRHRSAIGSPRLRCILRLTSGFRFFQMKACLGLCPQRLLVFSLPWFPVSNVLLSNKLPISPLTPQHFPSTARSPDTPHSRMPRPCQAEGRLQRSTPPLSQPLPAGTRRRPISSSTLQPPPVVRWRDLFRPSRHW